MSSGTPHDHCINTLKTIREITRNNETPLTGREYHVLITLITYRNSISFQCNPEIRKIAQDMNCAKSSVQTAIAGLKKKDFIRTTGHHKNGYKANNQYWVMHDIEKVLNAYNSEETSGYLMNYHDAMFERIEDYVLKYEY